MTLTRDDRATSSLLVRCDATIWPRLQTLAQPSDRSAAEIMRSLIPQPAEAIREPSQEEHACVRGKGS
jgi:hypothetical protein